MGGTGRTRVTMSYHTLLLLISVNGLYMNIKARKRASRDRL